MHKRIVFQENFQFTLDLIDAAVLEMRDFLAPCPDDKVRKPQEISDPP